jgi:hypothetical protein
LGGYPQPFPQRESAALALCGVLLYAVHMDALDNMIRDQLIELDRLRRELTAKEATVDALQQAAALRPLVSSRKTSTGKGGGKPKGAISAPWKETLGALYRAGQGPWGYPAIKVCFDGTNDKDLNLASIRDRVRSLVESGLMSGDADHGFTVTELAARKFNFKKAEAPTNGGASNEFGRVAELEVPARSEQHPFRKGENAGSSPAPLTPIVKESAFDADLDDDVPF